MSKYIWGFLLGILWIQPQVNAQQIYQYEGLQLKFITNNENKPFPKLGKRRATDGRVLNFDDLNKKVFIRFGFIGCHACEAENPTFIKLAKEFPKTLFVYISFDEPEDILREFSKYSPTGLPENLRLVSMDRKEIRSLKLTAGYPTNYFIDADNIVKWIVLGNLNIWGDGRKPYDVWKQKINSL